MRRLAVYLNREEVGRLTQGDSGLLAFSYKPEWIQRADASPLSRTLPLQTEPFRGKQARPFFAGILPEEGPRKTIASILGISERNDFAMLERIGGECAGAASLFPEGSTPPSASAGRPGRHSPLAGWSTGQTPGCCAWITGFSPAREHTEHPYH